MKKISTRLLTLLFALVLSQNALAANKRCGVGSRLFGWSKGILSQVSEVSTNGSSSGDASISYGTSGCKHDGNLIHKIIGKSEIQDEQIMFAEVNYEEIVMEMSQGQGEVLKGFAMTLGCSERGVGVFSTFTREHFEKLVPSIGATGSSPQLLLNNLSKEANQNPDLLKACDWA